MKLAQPGHVTTQSISQTVNDIHTWLQQRADDNVQGGKDDFNRVMASTTLDEWLWNIEPHFYPQHDRFMMDPAGYAAKIQNPPGHSKHDAVAYFILPLIDVAANDGDILQLAVTPTVPGSVARVICEMYPKLIGASE